eukprot:1475803-Rhodomonas_salina.1
MSRHWGLNTIPGSGISNKRDQKFETFSTEFGVLKGGLLIFRSEGCVYSTARLGIPRRIAWPEVQMLPEIHTTAGCGACWNATQHQQYRNSWNLNFRKQSRFTAVSSQVTDNAVLRILLALVVEFSVLSYALKSNPLKPGHGAELSLANSKTWVCLLNDPPRICDGVRAIFEDWPLTGFGESDFAGSDFVWRAAAGNC